MDGISWPSARDKGPGKQRLPRTGVHGHVGIAYLNYFELYSIEYYEQVQIALFMFMLILAWALRVLLISPQATICSLTQSENTVVRSESWVYIHAMYCQLIFIIHWDICIGPDDVHR